MRFLRFVWKLLLKLLLWIGVFILCFLLGYMIATLFMPDTPAGLWLPTGWLDGR
jgi:hypothetical protein